MSEKKQTGDGITRRDFHKLGSAALIAAGAPLFARAARGAHHEAQLVTDVAANAPLLEQIQYVHESAKEGQQCANCILYTAGEGGLGKCQILPQGLVEETGWCLTWAKKP